MKFIKIEDTSFIRSFDTDARGVKDNVLEYCFDFSDYDQIIFTISEATGPYDANHSYDMVHHEQNEQSSKSSRNDSRFSKPLGMVSLPGQITTCTVLVWYLK